MSRTTLIGIVALLFALPIFYVAMNVFMPQVPLHSFRGLVITPVHEANGQVTVPTIEEDEKGATMHATFKPAFLEKMAGVKSPNPAGLDITVDGISDDVRSCDAEGKIPAKASFAVAESCAAADFENWKTEKKGGLLVDPQQQLIVFGATSNNLARVYYNNLIATYTSPDMTQSDRKREACIARVMLDHLVGAKPASAVNCAAAP